MVMPNSPGSFEPMRHRNCVLDQCVSDSHYWIFVVTKKSNIQKTDAESWATAVRT